MSDDVNYFICDDFFGDDGLLYSLLYKCYVNQKDKSQLIFEAYFALNIDDNKTYMLVEKVEVSEPLVMILSLGNTLGKDVKIYDRTKKAKIS